MSSTLAAAREVAGGVFTFPPHRKARNGGERREKQDGERGSRGFCYHRSVRVPPLKSWMCADIEKFSGQPTEQIWCSDCSTSGRVLSRWTVVRSVLLSLSSLGTLFRVRESSVRPTISLSCHLLRARPKSRLLSLSLSLSPPSSNHSHTHHGLFTGSSTSGTEWCDYK
jgi:hypothetical protein